MKGIVFSDLDNTFLNPNGSVPTNADKFVGICRKKGLIVSIATSRPLGNIRSKVLPSFKADFVIANDGAITAKIINGYVTVISELNLDPSIVSKAIDSLIALRVSPIIFYGSSCDFTVLVSDKTKSAELEALKLSDPSRPIAFYSHDNLSTISSLHVRSVSGFGQINPKIAKRVAVLVDNCQVLFYEETRFSGGWWLDVVSSSVDKSHAATDLVKLIGTDKFKLVLGDGLNDIGLFQTSTVSFCPVTAHDQIKSLATKVLDVTSGYQFVNAVIKELNKYG